MAILRAFYKKLFFNMLKINSKKSCNFPRRKALLKEFFGAILYIIIPKCRTFGSIFLCKNNAFRFAMIQ
ncbi:hypothetical protein CK910_14530 [Aeromonas sp. CA23]|nr:hypothetical protein CK910_14530 [Aeromonas sp. CA23]